MTLDLWLFKRSSSRSAGALGTERACPRIPAPLSQGAESVPRTSLSLGSGLSGFSQPLASLGVKLPLLPLEAHRGAEATFCLWPRWVVRAAPSTICSGVDNFEIFHPSPSVSLSAAWPFPGLHAQQQPL